MNAAKKAFPHSTYLALDVPEIDPQLLQQRRLPVIPFRPKRRDPPRPQPALLPHAPADGALSQGTFATRTAAGRSRTWLGKGWSGPRRGPRRRMGRIGGFAGCRVVVAVGGSIGPWRPGGSGVKNKGFGYVEVILRKMPVGMKLYTGILVCLKLFPFFYFFFLARRVFETKLLYL